MSENFGKPAGRRTCLRCGDQSQFGVGNTRKSVRRFEHAMEAQSKARRRVDITTPRINEVPAMRNTQGWQYLFVIDCEFEIDAMLGNDAESAKQSIVLTQEFFRLVFVLIAPQNKHCRLSPKNPEKPHVPPNKLTIL